MRLRTSTAAYGNKASIALLVPNCTADCHTIVPWMKYGGLMLQVALLFTEVKNNKLQPCLLIQTQNAGTNQELVMRYNT